MARRAAARSLRPRRHNRFSTKKSVDQNRSLSHQALERRELLAAGIGPQLISVSANSGENFRLAQSNTLNESPTQLTFRFDGSQQIDAATLNAITIERSGGDGVFGPDALGNVNDIRITPGFLGFGDSQRIVVARFAETLPDDQYRIRIAGFDDTNVGIVGLRNTLGELFDATNPASQTRPEQVINFQVEIGPQVVAVVPQPIVVNPSGVREQRRSEIHVYFNDDKLSNPALGPIDSLGSPTVPVVNRTFYNLFFTNNTVENNDDVGVQPTNVTYDPALNRAVLEFSTDLALLPEALAAGGEATYRLRVGSSQALPNAPTLTNEGVDAGSTFATARDLGVSFPSATQQSLVVSGEIEPTINQTIQWPGFNSPGIRDNRLDSAITGQPDTINGINRYFYNFASVYGTTTGGVQDNAITPAQKQRAREVLSLYAQHLGVEFIETEDRGLQIVTGVLRTLVDPVTTGPGVPFSDYRVNDSDPTRGVLILDSGENWYDGYGLSPDVRPSWFTETLRGVGSLLGLGSTFEQVPGTASGSNPSLYGPALFPNVNPTEFSIEPDFLSTNDIIPGQALHRPETRDVDLYRFVVSAAGKISLETFAQRLDDTSLLNSDLKLWKLNSVTSAYELVAKNDDFYSLDSFISVDVSPNLNGTPATYVVGVTAKGTSHNPDIAGSGGGGTTQGRYDLRITFRSSDVPTIRDTDNTALDGDGDGVQGGEFNFWFRTTRTKDTATGTQPLTLFVDKAGVDVNSLPTHGTVQAPFQTIKFALAQARPGDIVRILPSAGADGSIGTTADNLAYEIGRGGATESPLSDGETFNVPRGVTVMIDAGTIIKLRNAKISVGSERIDEDRSLAALQILGAPILVNAGALRDTVVLDATGEVARGEVIITSYNEERRDGVLLGVDTNALQTTPERGDWAGIEFRNDFDYSEGRPVWESEGIFLDYASHANVQFGGGSIAPTEPIVNPLQMIEARPTLIFNTIRNSRDAAISADPNSFLETNFHSPLYQRAASFTSDYDRVGPDLRGNRLLDNTNNALFVRVVTPPGGERQPQTVSGRFNDTDVVHAISDVLVLRGQPGGALMLQQRPDVLSVTLAAAAGSPGIDQVGVIDYRITFINADGSESLASLPTAPVTVAAGQQVSLANLPSAPTEFAGRRLYRLVPGTTQYVFVAQLDRATQTYVDTGVTRGGFLPAAAIAAATGERLLPRFDARLSVDPGTVVKLNSARIEATFGADFYAEGLDGKPVVFTSRLDDSFGAGGTFDTNNDGSLGVANPGDWSGFVFRQGSTASLDNAIVRFGGGSSAIPGGNAQFNTVEILQAEARVANSTFQNNAAGSIGGFSTREGIGFNGPATIFVRGAQPVIVDNIIRDNAGAAISINPDALNYYEINDAGRSTGMIDLYVGENDNQGPLIAGNRLDNNAINGMLVRNESLTTESVWDDTDIVHVVEGQVYAWNHNHRSGLRLKSDPNQSLVVKFQNGGALVADRYRNDVEDSIGGTLQVIGQPGFPVVLTSIADDTVGAGFTPGGIAQTNTDNLNVTPVVNWRGLVIAPGANDRNVAIITETEPAIPTASSRNAIPTTAQIIGSLARSEYSSDENRRAGFNIRGTLSQNSDLDVYSFFANGGTEVYFDIDETSFGLDTVIELIDVNGNILAQSNNSAIESNDPSLLVNRLGPGFSAANQALFPLLKSGAKSFENPNPLDAGFRAVLSGSSSTLNQYYIRVRSNNNQTGGAPTQPSPSAPGLSKGQYQLGIRLRETDEVAGSTVRLADIRYAATAISVPAAPSNSPLVGEHAEELNEAGFDINDSGTSFNGTEITASFTNGNADPLGSLNASNRGVLRVSGFLGNQQSAVQNGVVDPILAEGDLDVYRVDILDDRQNPDIIGENRFVSTIFDIDYADQLGRANTSVAVYNSVGQLILHSRDSNIADDQGRPSLGVDQENLQAGSAGNLDAFIGPVELQVGTYYVVVSSAQMIPQSLGQLFLDNPADTNVRLLPINSQRNLAEFGFELFESPVVVNGTPALNPVEIAFGNQTAELPLTRPFFDHTSIVPYTLEDVRMFLTVQGGLSGTNQSTLISINPFTGQLERTIGQFGQPVGDLAMRRDGELFAYSLGPQTGPIDNGNAGNFLNISAVNAAANSAGDDTASFRQSNAAGNGVETANPDTAQLIINAMAFTPIGANTGALATGDVVAPSANGRVFLVGNRDNRGRAGELPTALVNNILYSAVETNGNLTNRGSTAANTDRGFGTNRPLIESDGPASVNVDFGIIDVGQFLDSDPRKTQGIITGLAQDPLFTNNRLWGVTNAGGVYSFNPNDLRNVDSSPTLLGGYDQVINTTFYGGVARDPLHVAATGSTLPPQFSSLTFGPRSTESRRYENVLFATTTDGWLYTLRIDAQNNAQPANVLVNGRSAIRITTTTGAPAITGGRSVNGVAFTIREENPFHVTSDRSNPFGVPGPNATTNIHGVNLSHDQSRITQNGGASLYFGFEPDTNAANNTLNDSPNGNLAPGGVRGSAVSRPFSLESYSFGDKPTLYFNYFLEVQSDADFQPPSRAQVDAFRVYIAGDDGQWRQVTTNSSYRSFSNVPSSDEYDNIATNGGIPVQELFENTDVWRQARVDLSPLAGHKNVQIRYEFSTSGESQGNLLGYITEIQAVAGRDILNGSGFDIFENDTATLATLEFTRGAAINIPDPADILDGQRITFTRPAGTTLTVTLNTGVSTGPNSIPFDRSVDTAETIAAAIALALQTLAPELVATNNAEQLIATEATAFTLTPARFGHAAVTVPASVSTLVGESISLTNHLDRVTTVTLQETQQVTFNSGLEAITVTPNTPGFADGVFIRFVDEINNIFPLPIDQPARASFNLARRVITVTYNSDPAFAANNDVAAITAAIDGLAQFAATSTGNAAFVAPTTPVQFSLTELYFDPLNSTPAQIATAIAAKFNTLDPSLTVAATLDQVVATGAADVALSAGFTAIANPTSVNAGDSASQYLPSGNVPIFYHNQQTSTEVRDAIRTALANGIGRQSNLGVPQSTIANYPGFGTNRIRVYSSDVLSNNTSAVGFSTFLPGDEFGLRRSNSLATSQISTRGAEQNGPAQEGVYIDDIVVGFAERGEVVYNAPANNRNFIALPETRTFSWTDSQVPEFPNEILIGGYTLEVRQGSRYGVPEHYDPIRLGLDEQVSLGRSFDTNDRHVDGVVTLIVPTAATIVDGDTFVLSNGSQRVTFEFDAVDPNNPTLPPSVQPGRVRVPFTQLITGVNFDRNSVDTSALATAIRDAINSPQARNVLGILAAGRDGSEVGPVTGNRIDLFAGDTQINTSTGERIRLNANDIQVNPSSGKFIKLDLVRAETPYGRETGRTIPVVDQATRTVGEELTLFSFPKATATEYNNGRTDTLVAVGKIGDSVGTDNANALVPSFPGTDVDIIKIFLNAGDRIDLDIDTTGFALGNPLVIPAINVFDQAGTGTGIPLATSPLTATSSPGEFAAGTNITDFLAPASGFYYVAIFSRNGIGFGEYQLTIRPNGVVPRDVLFVDYHFGQGDTNVVRQQGQVVIESNFISNFSTAGVAATFGNRQLDDDAAFTSTPLDRRPGSASLLRNNNTDRLVPGTIISNNVIVATAGTGIIFSGETLASGDSPAPVPFGRIVNNTLVGPGSGTGIAVGNAASPTVLNNIVSRFATGLNVSANSSSTIENGNAYQGNTINANITLSTSSFDIPVTTPLFQNAANGVFIPAAGSLVIDSSFASIGDRGTFFNTVKSPMGVGVSPIIAPTFDAYGIPRFDDPTVTTPSGVGSNVFIDRGAIDRADFLQPRAVLVNPQDFIAGQGVQIALGDTDPDASFVRLPLGSSGVAFFEVQLLDPAGTGPDPSTITSNSVILTEDGQRLTPGIDYIFGYSDNSRVIRLTPTAGLWRPDSVYEITLNNQNRVQLNLPAGNLINDGDRYIVTDTSGRRSTLEFDSGYVLQVPQTLGLQVTGANNAFNDGDSFVITSPSGATRTFEINLVGAVATNRIAINLQNAGTVEEVRDVFLAALSVPAVATALDLVPRAFGTDSLQIGSLAGHTLTSANPVAGLTFIGVADGVTAGEQFSYQSGPDNVLFEFTFGGPPSNPSAVAIPISRSSTIDEIGTLVADTLKAQPLGLVAARSLCEGRVLVGGNTGEVLTLVNTSLEVIGTPGVSSALTLTVPLAASGTSINGRTFSITNGTITENFIFTTNPALVTPARRVVVATGATADQIAQAMAIEINAGFAGALSPSAVGNVVRLGEQPAVIPSGTAQVLASVSVGTSPLIVTGVSGGSIPVPFIPSSLFTPASSAASFATALATSPLSSTTFLPGGGTLLFSQTSLIDLQSATGQVTTIGANVPAIADLAGNRVASNRDNGETRFTIIMPEVRFDFGDALITYGTLFADNGARHSVGSAALPRLGRIIDTELDGQPAPGMSDDTLAAIDATSPGGSPLFSFSSPAIGARDVTINDITPTSGTRLEITISGVKTTFELVTIGIAPAVNNIPVPFIAPSGSLPGDSPEIIATRIANAIRGELTNAGGALTVTIDPSSPTVIELRTVDDEDGVSIGTFGGRTVFLVPGAATPTADADDVLGFLNPQDPLGSNVSITVTGNGLLDAWIDFNKNGIFDSNEQVLRNAPVVDGDNTLRIFTPASATDGPTWARFRLSAGGNLGPTGVAIGGEVEDYQVQIIKIPLPTPTDDIFEVNEDSVLDTETNVSLPSVIDNDDVPVETFLPVRFFIGQQPTNGTLTVTDPTSGRFVYTPAPDFSGVDTFTYRLSTQANAGATAPSGVTFATVTINVRPVNDAPLATNKTVVTLEDTPVTVDADTLLVGAIADANPSFPSPAPTLPWNEANQNLRVLSLNSGGFVLDASNFTTTTLVTPRGSIRADFDTTSGDLIDFVYTPGTDLNRDNVLPVGSGPVFDTFGFTIQDDGILIDPETNNPLPGPFVRRTADAMVFVDVKPENDAPTATTDQVSVGIVGTTDAVTPWTMFFTDPAQPAPVPTEDVELTIPSAFLLANDLAGRTTTVDENNAVRNNDGVLTITAVNPVTPGLVVTLDADNNVVLTPPANVYGDVIFTYTIIDQGINEAIDGVTRTDTPLSMTGTVTVTLQPVNDVPVAFDRNLTYVESPAPGAVTPFPFTAAALLVGSVGETPAVPGTFASTLGAPFNESTQELRVIAFRTTEGEVNVSSLPPDGNGMLTLDAEFGGRYEFDFENGEFTVGRFFSIDDYNRRTPFDPTESFEFLIADDGHTPRPQGGGFVTLPSAQAVNFATATITVTETNDAPVFTAPSSINILERDDSGATLVPNFVTGILPGPSTASDELQRQTVSFEILTSLSIVPNGLMLSAPQIAPDGTLSVFPAPDAVGNAIYVFEAVDAEAGTVGFAERRTRGTVTIAVRPVNDAPIIDPAAINTSQTLSSDEAWSVDPNGVITYTLKEDNTGPLGVTSPYIINVRRNPAAIGYERIGLLDVFNAGPPNEEDSTEGGSQVLSLLSFNATTAAGGTIRVLSRDANNEITQLEYIPPADFNQNNGGIDSFNFTVQDNSTTGGETFNLGTGTLVDNQLSSIGTVNFVLRPVNDPPRFNVPFPEVSVLEDTGSFTLEDFATNIFAGPANSAFDEIDLNNGQRVTFAVTAVSNVAGLFTMSPTVSPNGTLSFQTAPDAYGRAIFEVRATDNGPDNATRGDIVSSAATSITINVRPVNDRPVLNTTTPLSFTLNEDAAVDLGNGTTTIRGTLIPLRGAAGQRGLLDMFNVGPANEAANITPGGNQTLRLADPIPAGTTNGGILTREIVDGILIGLRYTPRANFNGTDSFVYGVIDNGQSSDLDGNISDDFRTGFTTVSLNVIARNDAPVFGGAPSVTVEEDAITSTIVGQTIIANWATNIQAGPAGAADENDPITGQTVTFIVTPVAGNPTGLFATAPTVTPTGTLSFTTTADANGSAVFTIVARDSGIASVPLEFNTSSPPRTFTITVNAVNDPPTFTPGADVTVEEDSGPFNAPSPYATNILPGPPDEVAAGQTVRFEVTTPASGAALFAPDGAPRITDNGFLLFTPAANANGVVVVSVVAIDSEGLSTAAVPLTITINAVNDVPVANNDEFDSDEDTLLILTPAQLLANDVDPDVGQAQTIVSLPALSLNGATVRFGAGGNIEYDPRGAALLQALAPGQTRSDTFTYRVQDAAGALSNIATVTINVAGINDAPILLPDTPTLEPSGNTIIRPLENDVDIDGTIDPASLRITLQPAFGSVVVEADGTLVYTPFEGFRGQDIIRYTVADNLGLRSAEQTITIDINRAPIAVNDTDGTFRDEPVEINVAANDSDPDGSLDLDSIQIITPPVRGTATPIGGGIVRYLPEPGFTGIEFFEYTIRDNAGRASNVGRVSVQTVGSRLQNPRNFTDVNANGQTSALDALLIINLLSRAARQGLGSSIPVLPTDEGPDFYDTDGNLVITANDALRVINQIARDNRAQLTGEGEAAPAPQVATASVTPASLADRVVTTFDDQDYQVDFSAPSDNVVAAISLSSSEEDKEKQASDHIAAVDAAWADAISEGE